MEVAVVVAEEVGDAGKNVELRSGHEVSGG